MVGELTGTCVFSVENPYGLNAGAPDPHDELFVDYAGSGKTSVTNKYEYSGELFTEQLDLIGDDQYFMLDDQAEEGYGAPPTDSRIQTVWTDVLGPGSAAKVANSQWVKLTDAQLSALESSTWPFSDYTKVSSVTGLATALTASAGQTWKVSGTQMFDQTSCTVLTRPTGNDGSPAITLAVANSTGLPYDAVYATGPTGTETSYFFYPGGEELPVGFTISAPTQFIDGSTFN